MYMSIFETHIHFSFSTPPTKSLPLTHQKVRHRLTFRGHTWLFHLSAFSLNYTNHYLPSILLKIILAVHPLLTLPIYCYYNY